jgi:hypothetical protein
LCHAAWCHLVCVIPSGGAQRRRRGIAIFPIESVAFHITRFEAMRARLFVSIVTAVFWPVVAVAQSSATVAFTDVSVLPMDRERVLTNHTVIVRDGRIAAVGPSASVRVPADAQRVDGKGKFLMPGLAEMHAHVQGPAAPPELNRDIMFLYIANGVTTIRAMLGAPNQLALRDQLKRGEFSARRCTSRRRR